MHFFSSFRIVRSASAIFRPTRRSSGVFLFLADRKALFVYFDAPLSSAFNLITLLTY